MACNKRNKHSINFLVHEVPAPANYLFYTSPSVDSDFGTTPVDNLLHAAGIMASSASASASPIFAPHRLQAVDTFSAVSNRSSESWRMKTESGIDCVRKQSKKRPTVGCDICHRVFNDSTAVRKHRRAVHEKLKEFKCHICQRQFAEKSNMKKHIQARHDQRRSHKCDQCDKVFSFADGLRRHINNCHLGLRPYQCNLCNFSFKQRTHLQKHRKCVHRVVAEGEKVPRR